MSNELRGSSSGGGTTPPPGPRVVGDSAAAGIVEGGDPDACAYNTRVLGAKAKTLPA